MKKISFLPLAFSLLLSLSGTASAETKNLYSVSNKADANTVVVYTRGKTGDFRLLQEIETGGKGTGDLEVPALKKDPTHPLANGDDPLISANGIAVTQDGRNVLTVNPGDSSVSLFRRSKNGSLAQVNTAESSDRFPLSVAAFGDLVAVASVGNTNGEGSIGLMRMGKTGLQVVKNSRRDLKARPSTIAFSTSGKYVIVNELVTGKIKTFAVAEGNLSLLPVSVIDSPKDEASRFQAIPVGFTVKNIGNKDIVIMSEARFLTPAFKLRGPTEGIKTVAQSPLYTWQTGSLSTYHLNEQGKLSLISGDVLTGAAIEGGELANCWVVASPDGKTIWAVNALSSSISSFRLRQNGTVALKNDRAHKIESELPFLSDIAINHNGSEMYQLVGNKGDILVFDVSDNGDLKHKSTIGGLPTLGAFGLAAY